MGKFGKYQNVRELTLATYFKIDGDETLEYAILESLLSEGLNSVAEEDALGLAFATYPELERFFDGSSSPNWSNMSFDRRDNLLMVTDSQKNCYEQTFEAHKAYEFCQSICSDVIDMHQMLEKERENIYPSLPRVYGYACAIQNYETIESEILIKAKLYHYLHQAPALVAECQEKLDHFFDAAPDREMVFGEASGRVLACMEKGALSPNLITPERAISLFPFDIYLLYRALEDSIPSANEHCVNLLLRVSERIPDDDRDIIYGRYGLKKGSKIRTLEEIGETRGVTRSRIGQIQAKIVDRLLERGHDCQDAYKEITELFKVMRTEEGFMYEEDLDAFLDDDVALEMAKFVVQICGKFAKQVHYSRRARVFYVGKFDKAVEEGFSNYPDVLSENEFEKMDERKRRILESSELYVFDGWLYQKRGAIIDNDVCLFFLREHFPNGYSLSTFKDYERFREEWISLYGDKNVPGFTYVAKIIESNWQYDGKGAYLPKGFSPEVPLDRYERMNVYIERYLPVVYYISVYYAFKKDLSAFGIESPEAFKDYFEKIDNKYRHHRDYLSDKKYNGSSYDAIYERAKELQGLFTINDLRTYFPRVDDFVFRCALAGKEDIVALGDGKYVHSVSDRKKPREDSEEKLKKFIREYFESNHFYYVNENRLYKLLEENRADLLEELDGVSDALSLKDFISRHLNDDFEIDGSRIILKGVVDIEGMKRALDEYMIGKDHINWDNMARDFEAAGLDYHYISFYLNVVLPYKESFVRVTKNVLFSKESLNLSDYYLESFFSALDNFINNDGSWDSREFNKYYLFPKSKKFDANRYSVAGLAMSYGSDRYEVVATSGNYKAQNFVIKRKTNG